MELSLFEVFRSARERPPNSSSCSLLHAVETAISLHLVGPSAVGSSQFVAPECSTSVAAMITGLMEIGHFDIRADLKRNCAAPQDTYAAVAVLLPHLVGCFGNAKTGSTGNNNSNNAAGSSEPQSVERRGSGVLSATTPTKLRALFQPWTEREEEKETEEEDKVFDYATASAMPTTSLLSTKAVASLYVRTNLCLKEIQLQHHFLTMKAKKDPATSSHFGTPIAIAEEGMRLCYRLKQFLLTVISDISPKLVRNGVEGGRSGEQINELGTTANRRRNAGFYANFDVESYLGVDLAAATAAFDQHIAKNFGSQAEVDAITTKIAQMLPLAATDPSVVATSTTTVRQQDVASLGSLFRPVLPPPAPIMEGELRRLVSPQLPVLFDGTFHIVTDTLRRAIGHTARIPAEAQQQFLAALKIHTESVKYFLRVAAGLSDAEEANEEVVVCISVETVMRRVLHSDNNSALSLLVERNKDLASFILAHYYELKLLLVSDENERQKKNNEKEEQERKAEEGGMVNLEALAAAITTTAAASSSSKAVLELSKKLQRMVSGRFDALFDRLCALEVAEPSCHVMLCLAGGGKSPPATPLHPSETAVYVSRVIAQITAMSRAASVTTTSRENSPTNNDAPPTTASTTVVTAASSKFRRAVQMLVLLFTNLVIKRTVLVADSVAEIGAFAIEHTFLPEATQLYTLCRRQQQLQQSQQQ